MVGCVCFRLNTVFLLSIGCLVRCFQGRLGVFEAWFDIFEVHWVYLEISIIFKVQFNMSDTLFGFVTVNWVCLMFVLVLSCSIWCIWGLIWCFLWSIGCVWGLVWCFQCQLGVFEAWFEIFEANWVYLRLSMIFQGQLVVCDAWFGFPHGQLGVSDVCFGLIMVNWVYLRLDLVFSMVNWMCLSHGLVFSMSIRFIWGLI